MPPIETAAETQLCNLLIYIYERISNGADFSRQKKIHKSEKRRTVKILRSEQSAFHGAEKPRVRRAKKLLARKHTSASAADG